MDGLTKIHTVAAVLTALSSRVSGLCLVHKEHLSVYEDDGPTWSLTCSGRDTEGEDLAELLQDALAWSITHETPAPRRPTAVKPWHVSTFLEACEVAKASVSLFLDPDPREAAWSVAAYWNTPVCFSHIEDEDFDAMVRDLRTSLEAERAARLRRK